MLPAPHPIPAYRFWGHYIKNGIKEAGMEWLDVPGADWAEGLLYNNGTEELKNWRDKIWQLTLDYIKANPGKIDLFLCYLYPQQIDVTAINEIKKLGIPCVNFYCDNVREFSKAPDKFKVFDLVWVPEYEAISMYKQANINYINLPMPMWVDKKYRQNHPIHENPVLSFIGSKDIYRIKLLAELLNKDLPLTIRGNGWAKSTLSEPVKQTNYKKLINQAGFIKQHGLKGLIIKWLQKNQTFGSVSINPEIILQKPDFETYIHITQNSAITLGINRVPTFKRTHTNPLVYSRLRDIEAPMLGACYLTEYCEGLGQLYDLENEVYAYRNTDELNGKARELLNDKEKRLKLRINGQHKALTQLSIPVTLGKLKAKLF